MLVLVMTGQSLYERKGDVLVFRAFGLQKMRIVVLFIIESCALIFFASCIAYVLAHGIAYVLNTFLFSFETFIFANTPLWIVVGISIFVASFAFFVSQTLVRTPLKKLLAEK
jgi:ABC-type lipoprotein release transport system permease subunit